VPSPATVCSVKLDSTVSLKLASVFVSAYAVTYSVEVASTVFVTSSVELASTVPVTSSLEVTPAVVSIVASVLVSVPV